MNQILRLYLSPVFREFSAEKPVGDENLSDDVDEIEAFADEELGRPRLVITGMLDPDSHVVCQLLDLLRPLVLVADGIVEAGDDFLKKISLTADPIFRMWFF